MDTLPKRDVAVNRSPGYRRVKGDADETIIRLDHDLKVAEVWTPNRRVQGAMRRAGAASVERQVDGQWWRVEYRVGSRGIIFGKRRSHVGFGRRKTTPADIPVAARA